MFAVELTKTVAIFLLIYLSCNYFNSTRTDVYHLYTNNELQIPFLTWTMFFYVSVYLTPLMAPILLNEKELRLLARSIANSLFICMPIFLLLPTQLGFVREVPVNSVWAPLYEMLFVLDKPHNLFPSFHVIFSTLMLFPFARNCKTSFFKYFWYILSFAIDLSILFVHQHHVIDLVAGLFIGVFLYQKFYVRNLEGESVTLKEVFMESIESFKNAS